MTSQFFFFCISAFWIPCLGGAWWKTSSASNLVGIGSWGPEIWRHEYLLSPIEISVNWPGSKQLWTRPNFTLISMGLIRYSCEPYLGPPWTDSCHIWVWGGFSSYSTETACLIENAGNAKCMSHFIARKMFYLQLPFCTCSKTCFTCLIGNFFLNRHTCTGWKSV